VDAPLQEIGQPASYELFDQIWLSPSLQDNLSESWIERRTQAFRATAATMTPPGLILDL
jgi:hypothetical protein